MQCADFENSCSAFATHTDRSKIDSCHTYWLPKDLADHIAFYVRQYAEKTRKMLQKAMSNNSVYKVKC
jgi:hypothetical protein